MKKTLRCAAAILLAMALMAAYVPTGALGTNDYNDHDVGMMRTFFELLNSMGITNGVTINGSNYDPDDPSTWGCCSWNSAGRLTQVSFNNKGAVGDLDVSGCTELTKIACYACRITGLVVDGCSKLTQIEADHNKITELDVTGCPKLTILWVANNKLTELDITNCPLLTRLSCGSNQIPELNVPVCPGLNYLDCGENLLTELDVTNCPLLVEFICKNNLLTELDISNCTHLERFRSLGNHIKHLDISVLNGGTSFVLDALGSGYVGTICNVNSSGVHTLANAAAAEGSGYYGWYEGDSLLTDAVSYECVFGSGAKHYTAHFDVPVHTLTVNYVYENGAQAAPAFTAEYEEGEHYSVVSPVIEGYNASITLVDGVMGESDLVFTVTYSPIPIPKHRLTIYYVYEDGSTAARTYSSVLEEGASYSVVPPAVAGYYPDTDVVAGVMGTEDIYVTVTYYPAMHELKIIYVYADGSEAAPAHIEQVMQGTYYCVFSPTVTGHTPNLPMVDGFMGEEDVFVTVTYQPRSYELLIHYVFENGETAAPDHRESVVYGAEYSVLSPYVEGYSPDAEATEGVMGAGNVTVTVTYYPNFYELLIHYVFEDGEVAAPDHSEAIEYGASYSVPSPVIEGYLASVGIVEGVMSIGGVEVTVVYILEEIPTHELTIRYVFDDGGIAHEAYSARFAEGESYSVASPVIEGYDANIEVVEGVMGSEDVLFEVVYTARYYELKIHYVYADGSEAAPDYIVEVRFGADYAVESPEIEGLTADLPLVAGVMPAHDVEITVTYTEASPVLMGDVDGNGVVNSNDSLLLLRFVMGIIEPTEQIQLAGDVDGNGRINANDALTILRLVLGIITLD